MSANPQAKKIYVIAGEASGDIHGAKLIEALRKISSSPLTIYGVGGDQIQRTGALDFFDLAHFHVTGFTQAVLKIPQYHQAGKTILASIQNRKPDVVVLIDNPGFNLYLAKKINALRIPVIYYISPQIWAWKKNRIHKIKQTVAKMLVVFEFEKSLYEAAGIPVTFVGHPLKDILAPAPELSRKRWISLMPGSRKNEVSVLLPILLKAAEKILAHSPDISFKLIKSPTLPTSFYEPYLRSTKLPLEVIEKEAHTTLRQSLLVLVCSGTATLECALLGTPMIITNRAGFITYALTRALIQVPYLGLPNLILGREAMPELLQYQATPENFSKKAIEIISNPTLQKKMTQDLAEISKKLGPGGAAQSTAEEILTFLRSSNS